MADPIVLSIVLEDNQAYAVAEIIKRLGPLDLAPFGYDQREADYAYDALCELRRALAEKGVAVR